MSNNVAQLPDSYTLTLTLSHTWERECGSDKHYRLPCSRSIGFRLLNLDLGVYTIRQECERDSNDRQWFPEPVSAPLRLWRVMAGRLPRDLILRHIHVKNTA